MCTMCARSTSRARYRGRGFTMWAIPYAHGSPGRACMCCPVTALFHPQRKTMKNAFRTIAAPFTFIGLLVYLLVAYTEGEYDPYE